METILILDESNERVRVKNIAELMNVKAPTAIEALGHLKKKELIVQQPYADIELTAKGRKAAREIYEKHHMLKEFLFKGLGLSEEIAEADACKMEHCLSKETIALMSEFIKRSKKKV